MAAPEQFVQKYCALQKDAKCEQWYKTLISYSHVSIKR